MSFNFPAPLKIIFSEKIKKIKRKRTNARARAVGGLIAAGKDAIIQFPEKKTHPIPIFLIDFVSGKRRKFSNENIITQDIGFSPTQKSSDGCRTLFSLCSLCVFIINVRDDGDRDSQSRLLARTCVCTLV